MTIRGMQTLLSLRQAGKRPALVFLDLIDEYRAPKEAGELERLTLCPEGKTRNDDLRPLVGLDVVIMARDWTEDLSGLYDRLTQYANEIILLVEDEGVRTRRVIRTPLGFSVPGRSGRGDDVRMPQRNVRQQVGLSKITGTRAGSCAHGSVAKNWGLSWRNCYLTKSTLTPTSPRRTPGIK